MADGDGFFSPEAGAARTRALEDLFGDLGEGLDYYLGPTGIPDRLRSLGAAIDLLNPVTPITEAMRDAGVAADSDRETAERLNALARSAGTVASFALPAAIFGRMATPAVTAVPETLGLPGPTGSFYDALMEDGLEDLVPRTVATGPAGEPVITAEGPDPWEGVIPDPVFDQVPFNPDIDDALPAPPEVINVPLFNTRDDLIGFFGGEPGYFTAMRDFAGARPADPDEAARNLMDYEVGVFSTFNPEDGWQPTEVTFGDLLHARPETVEALFASPDFNFRVDEINPDLTREQALRFFRDSDFASAEGATGLPFLSAEADRINQGRLNDWLSRTLIDAGALDPAPSLGRSADMVLEDDEMFGSAMFAPLTAAIQALDQPRYGSVDELRANLLRLGARGPELQLADDLGFFEALEMAAEDAGGVITDEAVQGALQFLSPLRRTEFSRREGAAGLPRFERNFLPGGQDYRETIFSLPQTPRSLQEGRGAPYFAPLHWPDTPNPAFHIRTARFPTESGDETAFHLGEVQSDMNASFRTQRALADRYTRPLDRSPLQWQYDLLQDDTNLMREMARLGGVLDDYRAGVLDEIPPELGMTPQQLEDRIETLSRRADIISMNDPRDPVVNPESADYREGLDPLGPETIRRMTQERYDLRDVPIARDSSDINQLAVARALDQAVADGADWLTFSTGDMAHGYTFGTREGQRTAYDQILPRETRRYLDRLNRHLAEVLDNPPTLSLGETVISADDGAYRVPGIRLTPEIREALSQYGIPSFRDGGIITLLK